ncbi:MAG: O-antigen ligase domain-containing protein, partial [Rubrivivax sp.]
MTFQDMRASRWVAPCWWPWSRPCSCCRCHSPRGRRQACGKAWAQTCNARVPPPHSSRTGPLPRTAPNAACGRCCLHWPASSRRSRWGKPGAAASSRPSWCWSSATCCSRSLVLAIGLAIDSFRLSRRGHGHPKSYLAYAAFALFCLLMIPLTTSRAGLVIALPALAGVLVLAGSLRALRRRENRPLAIGTLVALLLAFIGVRAALGWMAIDEAEELRHTLTTATLAMAKGQSPLGGGIGSFIPLFEQDAPRALWLNTYVNHAHNEYAQWWLTAGWLGLAVIAVVGAWLAVLVISLARTRGDGVDKAPAAACMVALLAMLAHSWVDYPLRTTTLMTLAGVLTGLMVA